jgi:tRNA dimethylallyltransferase
MKSKLYKKKTIILLGGPTASGKSDLAVNIAKLINGEIINADSMQVYKNFPILTSQPSKRSQKSIKHHMYGYFDTNKSYNGSIWLKDTAKKINQIIIDKKTPIIVGGTGLYLEFISSGISHIPNISEETKGQVKELFEKKGLEEMFNFLREIDPEYADKININDKLRINRALEVFKETKKNISYFHKKRVENNNYKFFKIFLAPTKEIIKINSKIRLEKMLKQGVLEEFNKNNIKVKSCNIQKAIGYQEINDYFKNKISLSEMFEKIIFSTKKYSKRQFTWFNNRYNAHLKIDSIKKSSLILETLSKIT